MRIDHIISLNFRFLLEIVCSFKMSDQIQPSNGLTITGNRLKLPESLLNHIVLPRFIPNDANDDLHLQEKTFLIQMLRAVHSLSEWLPTRTVKMFESFVNVHQQRTPEAVSEEINKLKPGNTFAMYVRCQNTVFMCHMPTNGSIDAEPNETTPVIVTTFPGRIGVKNVYNHPLDMEVRFFGS